MLEALLSRFTHSAALVCPHQQADFEGCLKALSDHSKVEELMAAADDDFWPEPGSWRAAYRPYNVKGGVLIIPVKGVLLNGFGFQVGSYATGYVYIQKALERGLADPQVRAIAFDINSGGGEVSGNFDLVDKIFNARAVKPIRAFVNEHAYSAAYSIASAAEKIIVPRTGGVGSIGVVTMHIDASKLLDDIGYKITFIHAGKHKVDGNPYEPLPDGVKARIQKRIDETYSLFVATVARNRGMSEASIRETEALTFSASEAMSNGLADSIGSLDDAVVAFATDLSANEGEEQMSKETDKAVDQAAVDTARAEGVAEGRVAGLKEGATSERQRISAILTLDEAKDRRDAAVNIALNSDLSVDQAKGLLATLPASAAAVETNTNTFEKAMTETGNPELGAGNGDEEKVSVVDSIFASAGFAKATK